jgi:hypothetical protein
VFLFAITVFICFPLYLYRTVTAIHRDGTGPKQSEKLYHSCTKSQCVPHCFYEVKNKAGGWGFITFVWDYCRWRLALPSSLTSATWSPLQLAMAFKRDSKSSIAVRKKSSVQKAHSYRYEHVILIFKTVTWVSSHHGTERTRDEKASGCGECLR